MLFIKPINVCNVVHGVGNIESVDLPGISQSQTDHLILPSLLHCSQHLVTRGSHRIGR